MIDLLSIATLGLISKPQGSQEVIYVQQVPMSFQTNVTLSEATVDYLVTTLSADKSEIKVTEVEVSQLTSVVSANELRAI